MFQLPIMVATRFAIYAGVRSITEQVLTENTSMDADSVQLPSQGAGVAAALVLGPYTDAVVYSVANKIRRRKHEIAE